MDLGIDVDLDLGDLSIPDIKIDLPDLGNLNLDLPNLDLGSLDLGNLGDLGDLGDLGNLGDLGDFGDLGNFDFSSQVGNLADFDLSSNLGLQDLTIDTSAFDNIDLGNIDLGSGLQLDLGVNLGDIGEALSNGLGLETIGNFARDATDFTEGVFGDTFQLGSDIFTAAGRLGQDVLDAGGNVLTDTYNAGSGLVNDVKEGAKQLAEDVVKAVAGSQEPTDKDILKELNKSLPGTTMDKSTRIVSLPIPVSMEEDVLPELTDLPWPKPVTYQGDIELDYDINEGVVAALQEQGLSMITYDRETNTLSLNIPCGSAETVKETIEALPYWGILPTLTCDNTPVDATTGNVNVDAAQTQSVEANVPLEGVAINEAIVEQLQAGQLSMIVYDPDSNTLELNLPCSIAAKVLPTLNELPWGELPDFVCIPENVEPTADNPEPTAYIQTVDGEVTAAASPLPKPQATVEAIEARKAQVTMDSKTPFTADVIKTMMSLVTDEQDTFGLSTTEVQTLKQLQPEEKATGMSMNQMLIVGGAAAALGIGILTLGRK